MLEFNSWDKSYEIKQEAVAKKILLHWSSMLNSFSSWFNFKLVLIYDIAFQVCSDWFSEPEIVAQKLDPLNFFKWCFSSIHFT